MQAAGAAGGRPPGPQPLSVGDALLYLDQVKIEFSEKPEIYNEFLDIMKNFKAQEIDTPGVIQRVSTLFRGYNKLILGFNTFLPEGYKIDLHQLEEFERQHKEREAREAAERAQAGRGSGGGGGGGGGLSALTGPAITGGAPGAQPPQVEFKQAKDYVTTIKKRFASEPHQATYKAFLKILHHYQEEQRNIMDVLEQVSALFADHPDLLKEFTYFLPDAVQEQAKERLNRAARESEMRKARQAEQQRLGPGGPQRRKEQRDREERRLEKAERYKEEEPSMRKLHKTEARKQAKKRASKSLRRDDLTSPYGYTIAAERAFFEHVKDTLVGIGNTEAWHNFLKHLNLYSQDVLSRKDMLLMVQGVFGPHTEMFEEFKMILNARGATDSVQNDLWYSMPLSEIDFSQCRKCTPSYRALPKDYPKPPCSERSPEEEAVLNDTWVSVPIGSEENYSFKHMRRNQYEEALFKCEDERFEIDMVIDSNTATIRVLEPLAEEIAALKAQEEAEANQGGDSRPPHSTIQYKLDKRTLGTIHLNAVTRIYGDHGLEVLELLRKNPAGAIPVVLRRLKQKDLEWRKARQDLNKGWKEVLERNYHKSLDHRSFYFTQQDKRAIMPRQLVQDIKERKADHEQEAAKAAHDTATAFVNGTHEPGAAGGGGATAPAAGGAAAAAAAEAKKKGGPRNAAANPAAKAARITLFSGSDHPEELSAFNPEVYGTPQLLLKYLLNAPNSASSDGSAPAADGHADPTSPQPPATTSNSDGNIGAELHKDVYQLALYAVEHSNTTSNDKERIARLWRDFFKGFLHLPDEVLPPSDKASNNASFTPSPADKAGDGAGSVLPLGEESFIGPQSLYVFLRLHHILYDRLRAAREICDAQAQVSKEAKAAHPLKAMRNDDADADDVMLTKNFETGYAGFKSLLMARLDGSFDPTKYEDGCRHLMGNRSYMLYTLDKVVGYLTKQLQHLADDEAFTRLQEVYTEEKEVCGGRAPTNYRLKAASSLSAMGQGAEEMYRMTYIPGPTKRVSDKVTIEGASVLLVEYLGLADEGAANKGIAQLLDEVRHMEFAEEDEMDDEEEDDDPDAEGSGGATAEAMDVVGQDTVAAAVEGLAGMGGSGMDPSVHQAVYRDEPLLSGPSKAKAFLSQQQQQQPPPITTQTTQAPPAQPPQVASGGGAASGVGDGVVGGGGGGGVGGDPGAGAKRPLEGGTAGATGDAAKKSRVDPASFMPAL